MGLINSFLLLLCLFALPYSAKALEPVQEVTSAKGLTAWLIEDHTNPIVAVRFAFRGGSALDPIGKEGLARLVASTMDEGAGSYNSQTFQGFLEDHSITLRFDASMDSFGGQLLTLTEDLPKASELLKLALTQPRFDDEPVERIRAQIISGLRQGSEDPNRIAALTLYKNLFGDHPYARGSKGTIEGMEALKRSDLQAFVKQRLGRDNLIVGIAGDITPDQVRSLLDTAFADLSAQARSWALPEVELSLNTPLEIKDKAVPQSSILLAQKGIQRHDPDFYAAYVLNYILGGGGFSSRLYEEVREKRGLVYSVYSYLANYEQAELWLMGAATQNPRVKETLDVIKTEWQKAATQGVSAQEVMNAKTYLTGSFPLRFGSSDSIASILVGMQKDNLPIDFLEKRNQEIDAVSVDAVNRMAKTLLMPDNLQAVVVGQPEGL